MGEVRRLTQRDKKKAERGEHRIICLAGTDCPQNRNDHCIARKVMMMPDWGDGGVKCGYFEHYRFSILHPVEFPPVEDTFWGTL